MGLVDHHRGIGCSYFQIERRSSRQEECTVVVEHHAGGRSCNDVPGDDVVLRVGRHEPVAIDYILSNECDFLACSNDHSWAVRKNSPVGASICRVEKFKLPLTCRIIPKNLRYFVLSQEA